MDIDKALAAAQRVERARAELKVAEDEFAALTQGKPISRARPSPKPKGKGSGGPSVSSRVLGLIQTAGPAGIPRADIISVVGKTNEVAVHSALKVHQNKGRVKNENGRWVLTAKFVKQLQAPPTTADAALLRVPG